MYTQSISIFLSKNIKIIKTFQLKIFHFYSCEKLQYIAWACFRNLESRRSETPKRFSHDAAHVLFSDQAGVVSEDAIQQLCENGYTYLDICHKMKIPIADQACTVAKATCMLYIRAKQVFG